MSECLVHEVSVDGPATHAIVIGVGNYPHLVGGGEALFPEHGGMRQLSSPPLSAIAFAEWLVTHHSNPSKPLSSVCLLAGAADELTFTHPIDGKTTDIQRPTFEAAEAAIRDWKARGDSNSGNLMIFYFCGHGIAHGPDLALLFEDFGSDSNSALDSALDFRRFKLGMERCKARHQVYFIDACRVGDRTIIDAAGYAGRPIFTPTTRRDRNLPVRQMPAFYSTFSGERAQARTNEVSLFTAALLQALRGGGADDTDGDWWVDTGQLQKSVQFLMERAYQNGYPSAQVNPVDDMSSFPIHQLTGEPSVPVVVGCRPSELNQETTLAYERDALVDSRPAAEPDWDINLVTGEYTFKALGDGNVVREQLRRFVRPPYRKVWLEIV